MTMVEISESKQNSDQVSEAYAVNLAPGVSIESLFPQYPQFEAASAILETHNNLTQQQKDAILVTAVGMSVKHDKTVQDFVAALDTYNAGHNSYDAQQKDESAKQYKEITKLYENNQELQKQADTIAEAWTNLYTTPITGREVFGGLCNMGVMAIPDVKKMSSKKKALLLGVVMMVTLIACSADQEAPQTQIILTTDTGKEYLVKDGRTVTDGPFYGYLIDYSTNLGSETKNRFQFAQAEVENTMNATDQNVVTTFQQINDEDVVTAEFFIVDTGIDGEFKLLDQYNNSSLYTLSNKDGRVILHVIEDGSDYLISDKLTNTGPTASATQSPEALVQNLDVMFKVSSIKNTSGSEPLATVTYEVKTATPVPTATKMATEIPAPTVDPNAPEGWLGDKDGKGNYILKEKTSTGEEIIKTWVEYKSATGEVLWEGWTFDKGGAPLLDWINNMEGYERDLIFNKVLCSDSVENCVTLPNIIHREKTPEQMNDVDLGSKAIASIYKRLNNGQTIPDGIAADKLSRSMQNGTTEIPFFVTDESNMMSFAPSPDHGVITILTDWDESEPTESNGFQEFYGYGNLLMRGKLLGIDSNGNLIGNISVKDPAALSNLDWMSLTLHFAAQVVEKSDCTVQYFSNTESVWIDFASMVNNDHMWIETE